MLLADERARSAAAHRGPSLAGVPNVFGTAIVSELTAASILGGDACGPTTRKRRRFVLKRRLSFSAFVAKRRAIR